jgi:glycosyltransferase involved in cell wall biosynthesis
MNILYLTEDLNIASGVTTHLLNLTNGLGKFQDYDIFIICGASDGLERFKNINAQIVINKNFLHKKRSYSNYLKALIFLIRFIRRNEIDVVHSHTHYAANLANHASRYCKIKTIQTNHGILETKGRIKHFAGEKIIAINEHIFEHLLNEKITNPDNIYFIRCGIAFPALPPKKVIIRIKVFAASRFVYEKGLDLYIKAVSMLPPHDRTNTEFYLAGEGKLENELKELNNKLNAGIKFIGKITDMPSLMRDTHIFVFPSRSATEGFPSVITEAAAYNNLIISSDCTGIEPVLQGDIDGLIFKSGDEYDLMIKLKLAIDSYGTFRQMAEHYYYKTKDLFNINTMVEKHKELYLECLKSQ